MLVSVEKMGGCPVIGSFPVKYVTEKYSQLCCAVHARGRVVEDPRVIKFEISKKLGSFHPALAIYCYHKFTGNVISGDVALPRDVAQHGNHRNIKCAFFFLHN